MGDDEPDHKKKLRRNRSFIVDNLLCVSEVLDHSLNEGVFSEHAIDKIRHIKEERQKIRFILDILDKKGADKFKKFCCILDKTSNELIASKLRSSLTTPTPPVRLLPKKQFGIISKEDRELFQKFHVELVENMLDVESVVDSLIEQELLHLAHRSLIFIDDNERRQQVRMLMTILPKKGKDALPALLTALKTTGNDYLFDKIQNYKKHHTK